jgi:predicted Zn-dependent protease
VSRAVALLLSALALGCTAPAQKRAVANPDAATPATPQSDARAEAAPVLVREDDGFLMPNAEDVDGAPAYIHYAREDMPIRVNVELPRLAARYASRDDTDAAVVAAIREWETAIQPAVPWFALEIVRDDPTADIQVEWKTRILGSAAGWGGIGWEMVDGKLRARGQFQYATKPCLDIDCQLDLAELKLLVAHEFGHTLGLGHCLDCDSAMNYSWQTAERTVVTEIDVRTIKALYEIPSGTRVDGALMIPLRGSAKKAQ